MKNENLNLTLKMLLLERKHGKPIADVVRDAFVSNEYSPSGAATQLGISRQSLWEWIGKLGMTDLLKFKREDSTNGRSSESRRTV